MLHICNWRGIRNRCKREEFIILSNYLIFFLSAYFDSTKSQLERSYYTNQIFSSHLSLPLPTTQTRSHRHPFSRLDLWLEFDLGFVEKLKLETLIKTRTQSKRKRNRHWRWRERNRETYIRNQTQLQRLKHESRMDESGGEYLGIFKEIEETWNFYI